MGKEIQVASPPNAAVEMQEKNIQMLTGYIQGLKKQIAGLQELPIPEDPLLVEINATDLAGMNLRVELLSLLLDHCRFAKQKLQDAQAHPEKKQQLLEEFMQHRKQLMGQLEAIDSKLDKQERKRMKLGLKMVQEALK